MKFIRAYPEKIPEQALRHRYIGFMHYLSNVGCSYADYFKTCQKHEYRQWSIYIALEYASALIWLLEQGLAKIVDEEHGVH